MITMELVIRGLKFIAENRDMSDRELADGLRGLGCSFTWSDFGQQFPNASEPLFEGMRRCSISAGAAVIINMGSNNAFSRTFGDNRFLSVDDDTSIYHFIRVVTGDDSYTKENVEKKNDGHTSNS